MIEVESAVLERAILALERGRLKVPLSAARLDRERLGALSEFLDVLGALDDAGLRFLLRSVLAERRKKTTRVETVWSGPRPARFLPRSTSDVLEELFRDAAREVLIVGFAFEFDPELFATLHERVKKGVAVRFIVDAREKYGARHVKGEAELAAFKKEFLEGNWPGAPLPEVFLDARLLSGEKRRESIHAKAVVVDGQHALVGSANFTRAGLDRNIELGLLVEGEEVATEIASLFTSLVDAGLVV